MNLFDWAEKAETISLEAAPVAQADVAPPSTLSQLRPRGRARTLVGCAKPVSGQSGMQRIPTEMTPEALSERIKTVANASAVLPD